MLRSQEKWALGRLLPLLLAAVMVVSLFTSALAQRESVAVARFEAADGLAVPAGTALSDLALPDELTAVVVHHSGEEKPDGTTYDADEEETIRVPVSWTDGSLYDPDTPGDYVFTAVLGSGYTYAEARPTLTVTVTAAAARRAPAKAPAATVASGTWGTCPWTLDSNGLLTISAGTMGAGRPPWSSNATYAAQVKTVKFNNGVIGNANSFAMFYTCSNLTSIDFGNFNTSNVTNMQSMFDKCTSLTNLNLSSFNTAKVTNMSYMFNNCTSMTSLNVSSFNTASVTNMTYMFFGCQRLTSLNVSSFNTSNVTNMRDMFAACSSLTNLDLSNFNTSNVTNMLEMFGDMGSMNSLNVSSFNTTKVTNMFAMFNNMVIPSLDLSNFNTSNVTNMAAFFPSEVGTLKLGNSFMSPSTRQSSFPSGSWLREEEGKVYTSDELAGKLLAGPYAGTYVRQAEHSMTLAHPVTYALGTPSSVHVTKNTNPSVFEATTTANGSVIVYTHISGLAAIDYSTLSVPGAFTVQYDDMATDADGNAYDVEITISNIVYYDILNSTKGYTDLYGEGYYFYKSGKTDFAHWLFPNSERSRITLDTLGSAVNVPATIRILDKTTGAPVSGSFVFGGYDLDIQSSKDQREGRGNYGYYSEGVNLVSGFDLTTLTLAKNTLLTDMGTNPSAYNGYRITGTQSDGATELSKFLIAADASGASFEWTAGNACGSTFLNDDQPQVIELRKADMNGNAVAGAGLELYRVVNGSRTLVTGGSWTSTSTDKGFFLVPGEYVMKETSAPTGYKAAAELTFRVDYDYNVHIVTRTDDGNGGTIEQLQEVELVRMTDDPWVGTVTITKRANYSGTLLPGAVFTLTGTYNGVAFTLTSEDNGDGTYTIADVPYGGPYTVAETTAPDGFAKAADQTVTVTTDGQVIRLNYVDEPMNAAITVKKVISNYADYGTQLKDQQFIVNLSGGVTAETALKHGETSKPITVTIAETDITVNVAEIVPYAYSEAYTVSAAITHANGTTETQTGKEITVKPGDTVVITVTNTFVPDSYFKARSEAENVFEKAT